LTANRENGYDNLAGALPLNSSEEIDAILESRVFAVVGVSRNPEKYGYLVWKALRRAGKTVYGINPATREIEGVAIYPTLASVPEKVEAAVMVVPPTVTEQAVQECARLGVPGVWMQPGAESPEAERICRDAGMRLVAGGPCIMVMLLTHNAAPRPDHEKSV
jgi:hypothetical protein